MRYVKKYTTFFYKQSVYKQLALGRQIATQLSELSTFALGNNENYILKKVEFFFCNKRKKAVKRTTHHNSAVSKALFQKL